mmetsp:Transcript_3927/g.4266  ORF Transcript_3927/g.4266 Transcript_3927/m.4266 type:complete len:302 (-) Transcript_3927:288-1193(-)
MGRCCIQIVMGPAGSGKSTYCHTMQQHCASLGKLRRRTVHVANLDPAAESIRYDCTFDIRDLISVDEVMEELGLGPNGSLIYCMEYLLENMDWLQDEVEQFDDDEYLILDCPGQLELYTHVPIMKRIVDQMSVWGFGSSMVSVFIVDATFVCDAPKFISGALLSLSAMVSIELPHVNVLSKCDLVDTERVEKILDVESATQLWSMEENAAADRASLSCEFDELSEQQRITDQKLRSRNRLTEAICSIIDDYSMVSYIPLDKTNEDSIDMVLSTIDHTVQYGEDLEVKGADTDDFTGEESSD